MPYAGGSSTNIGVEYQNWYLALLISYAFFEIDYIIFPEALKTESVIVDDIVVRTRNGRAAFSAKYRAPSKNLHWGLADLNSQGIFSSFKNQHESDRNCRIYLVSESNCYLFSEVFIRARNAIIPDDIYEILDSEYAIDQWNKTKTILNYNDSQLIDFAKKVEMRCIPLKEIQSLIKHRFTLFGYSHVKDIFFSRAVECSGRKTKIDKAEVNKWLMEETIYLKIK